MDAKNKAAKETKKSKGDDFDLDGYSDDWGDGSSDGGKAAGSSQPAGRAAAAVATGAAGVAVGAAAAAAGSFPPKLDMGQNQVAQGASADKGGLADNYSDEKWDDDDDFEGKPKERDQP